MIIIFILLQALNFKSLVIVSKFGIAKFNRKKLIVQQLKVEAKKLKNIINFTRRN